MTEGGLFLILCGKRLDGDGGNYFALLPGSKESAAQMMEIVIDAQQYAAVIDAADIPAVRAHPDGERVQRLLTGYCKAEGQSRGGGKHSRQILLKL